MYKQQYFETKRDKKADAYTDADTDSYRRID